MTRQLIMIISAALLAASCTAGDDSAGVASLETADLPQARVDESVAVDQEQAMLDLASCLRQQGIDIEDPTVDAEGNVEFGALRAQGQESDVDRATVRAAMNECVQNLEGVSLGRRAEEFNTTEFQDALVEFAACMRSNGFDMPDPDFAGAEQRRAEGGGGGGLFGEIDRNDPDFMAAEEACRDILPGSGGAGIGGRGQGS